MIHRKVLVVLGTVGALLIACGSDDLSDLCDTAEECAKKSGTAFSKTECENEAKADKEKAETKGCADQYDEYVDCVLDIDISCGDDLNKKIQAECGGKANTLKKCLE